MKNVVKLFWQIFILLFILVVIHVSSIQAVDIIDPKIKIEIDNFVKNVYLPASGINNLGLSIVRNGNNGSQEILYTTGYGMADIEKGIPMGEDTQGLLASVTKSLTSLVIVKFLSENFPDLGETVLDTPIRKLVPSANFTLIDRFRSERTNFRDLLSHRACFPSDDLQMAAEPFNSSTEIVYRQRYAEEVCSFRTGFQYNNQMYVIAGQVIGILANTPYEDMVQDLLTEIGMLNSTFGKKSDDHDNMPHRARPYYVLNNTSHPMNIDLVKRVIDSNPAGGLWSTPNDMAKYLRFHLNKGKVGNTQVILEQVMEWTTIPSNAAPVNYFKTTEDEIVVNLLAYGLGLMRASYDGWEYAQHSGYWSGFQTLFSVFPSQKLGIFTAINEGPLLLDQVVLHSFIFEILRDSQKAGEKVAKFIERKQVKTTKEKSRTAEARRIFERKIIAVRNINASDVVGVYGSGGSGDAEILEKFNPTTNTTELYLSYGKWAQAWLESYEQEGHDEDVYNFKVIWDTDIVQDNYLAGDAIGLNYARIYNQTLDFITHPYVTPVMSYGIFKLGVSLDKLPPIPWAPDSC